MRWAVGGLLIGLFVVGCDRAPSDFSAKTFRLDAALVAGARATVRDEYGRRIARLERQPGDPDLLASLATFYHANDFVAAAISAYDELRRRDPKNPDWPYRSALIYAQGSESQEALRELAVATALRPDFALAWWRTGALLSYTADKTAAAAAFQKALHADPQLAHAHVGLARLDLAIGNTEAACGELLRAIEIDPEFSTSYNLLAQAYRSLGRENEAREIERLPVSRHRHRDPIDPVVDTLREACFDVAQLRVAADMEFTSLHLERAIPLLERASRLEPDNAGVALALAKVYLADEQAEQAFPWLEKAIAKAPLFPEAHYVLAYERRRLGQGPAAIKAVTRGIDLNPDDASLRHLRGLCHVDTDEVAAAAADFAYAIELSPRNLTYLLALADIRWAAGLQDDAATLYARAADVAPLAVRPRLALAQLHLEKGELEKAHSWIVEAARVDPSSPEPNRMQAKYLVRLGMKQLHESQTAGAVDAFEMALQLRPDYLPALESLCLACLQADRSDEAISVLQRFIEANPKLAKPHYLLAVLRLEQGGSQDARDHLTAGVDLARESGDTATLSKIQNLQDSLAVAP